MNLTRWETPSLSANFFSSSRYSTFSLRRSSKPPEIKSRKNSINMQEDLFWTYIQPLMVDNRYLGLVYWSILQIHLFKVLRAHKKEKNKAYHHREKAPKLTSSTTSNIWYLYSFRALYILIIYMRSDGLYTSEKFIYLIGSRWTLHTSNRISETFALQTDKINNANQPYKINANSE